MLIGALRTVRLGPLEAIERDRWPLRLARADRGDLIRTTPVVAVALGQAQAALDAARGEAAALLADARAEADALRARQSDALREHGTRLLDALLARLPAVLAEVVDRSVVDVLAACGTRPQVRVAVERVLRERLLDEVATLVLPEDTDLSDLPRLPAGVTPVATPEAPACGAALLTDRGAIRVVVTAPSAPQARSPDLFGLDLDPLFLAIDAQSSAPPPSSTPSPVPPHQEFR